MPNYTFDDYIIVEDIVILYKIGEVYNLNHYINKSSIKNITVGYKIKLWNLIALSLILLVGVISGHIHWSVHLTIMFVACVFELIKSFSDITTLKTRNNTYKTLHCINNDMLLNWI